MKRPVITRTLAIALPAIGVAAYLFAAEPVTPRAVEYATIRWGGRENTHIIRPGGQVEFVGLELRKVTRPDRTDERSFYMNVVLNGLTKEGYRLVAMTHDDVMMERPVK